MLTMAGQGEEGGGWGVGAGMGWMCVNQTSFGFEMACETEDETVWTNR